MLRQQPYEVIKVSEVRDGDHLFIAGMTSLEIVKVEFDFVGDVRFVYPEGDVIGASRWMSPDATTLIVRKENVDAR